MDAQLNTTHLALSLGKRYPDPAAALFTDGVDGVSRLLREVFTARISTEGKVNLVGLRDEMHHWGEWLQLVIQDQRDNWDPYQWPCEITKPDVAEACLLTAERIMAEEVTSDGDWELAYRVVKDYPGADAVLWASPEPDGAVVRSTKKAATIWIRIGSRPGRAVLQLASADQMDEPYRAYLDLKQKQFCHSNGKKTVRTVGAAGVACVFDSKTAFPPTATWHISVGGRRYAVWLAPRTISDREVESACRLLFPAGAHPVRFIPVPGTKHGQFRANLENEIPLQARLVTPWTSMDSLEWKRFLFMRVKAAKQILDNGPDLLQAIDSATKLVGPYRRGIGEREFGAMRHRAIRRGMDENEARAQFAEGIQRHQGKTMAMVPKEVLSREARDKSILAWAKTILDRGETIHIGAALLEAPKLDRRTLVQALVKEASNAGWRVTRPNGRVARLRPPSISSQ